VSYDVFISHCASDRAAAEAACTALERDGHLCWMAPRDLNAGEAPAEASLAAIGRCKVFLLILSVESARSKQVAREAERARRAGLAIVPLQLDAVAPGVRGNLAAGVHDVNLAAFAPVVGREQAGEHVMRVQAFTQQLDAVDAVIGIDEGLRRDRAEAGGDIGHTRADGEEAGCNGDAELAGGRIACDDRPGHILSISVLLRSPACRADWRQRGGAPRRGRPR